MSIPDDVMESFNAGTRTESVCYVINDSVEAIRGKNKGRKGTIISLFSLDPVTTYLVEPGTEPWGDFQSAQSDLELTD